MRPGWIRSARLERSWAGENGGLRHDRVSTCLQALPRKAATPLLHETLAWHGFQLEQQPSSCQEVPAWLKRMRDRELAMPICPGLLPPGWIEAQGLIAFPGHPPLQETL